jgi:hypothetical protein
MRRDRRPTLTRAAARREAERDRRRRRIARKAHKRNRT